MNAFHYPCVHTSPFFLSLFIHILICLSDPCVPASSPSHGGDVAVYVFNISQPSLPTPFYSVLVSASVFMVLSTVFHSINYPNINQPSLPTPFYSALLSVSVFKALSTVFHSINSPNINQPSLPTPFFKKKKNLFLCLFLSCWPFQLYFIT